MLGTWCAYSPSLAFVASKVLKFQVTPAPACTSRSCSTALVSLANCRADLDVLCGGSSSITSDAATQAEALEVLVHVVEIYL